MRVALDWRVARTSCEMAGGELEAMFCGTLVHATNEEHLKICANRVLGVGKNGEILFVEDESRIPEMCQKHSFAITCVAYLKKRQFLMPGLIDTHIHAPQYPNTGTGHDLPLLDWLEKYTFPTEAKFKDLTFAEDTYHKVVRRLLNNGTTTASYFATLHLEATKKLCAVIGDLGQRAYVGKVCMDAKSPDYYIEETEKSAEDTKRFVQFVGDLGNPLVTAVITPRFAVSCTSQLMLTLGEIATTHNLPIQSHLNENKSEIQLVEELFPESDSYTGVYKDHNLLNSKTYMAHCCHFKEGELELLATCHTGVAHCPASNFGLRSGIADVRHFLDKNMKVGLGTDVSGGSNPSMLSAIRECITASNAISIERGDPNYRPVDYKDAFFLATLGGSQVLGLEENIGNFEVGKEFDAILVDPEAHNSPFDCFEQDAFEDVVQKFIYLGDDRNLARVWVAGKLVAGTCFAK